MPPARMIPNSPPRTPSVLGSQVSPAVAGRPKPAPPPRRDSTRIVAPADLQPVTALPATERPPTETELLRREVRELRAILGELRARIVTLEILTPLPSIAREHLQSRVQRVCACEGDLCTCDPYQPR